MFRYVGENSSPKNDLRHVAAMYRVLVRKKITCYCCMSYRLKRMILRYEKHFLRYRAAEKLRLSALIKGMCCRRTGPIALLLDNKTSTQEERQDNQVCGVLFSTDLLI
eukprot:GILK01016281.1.p1 GENE.GILK01016281.1~~GILK01016281.1.p1  ORF type:complete len:108 (-),score=0.08 GILK01016281.1:82-405(-)